MSGIPADVREAAEKACGLCGVTPTSDMRVHAVHVAVTAILAERQRHQWQPIETAPKDGAVIDLWHEEFGRTSDCYWGKPQHCCGEYGSYCDSDWHGEAEGWVFSTLNEYADEPGAFTHWMHLPPAPKGGE